MKAIIDADSLTYIIGWHCKDLEQTPESYTEVIKQTDAFLNKILIDSKATEYIGFLGGVHPTFRHMMNREYKADRGLTKPDWYQAWGSIVNHRLTHYWKFNLVEGIEAEDAVSMMAYDRVVEGDYVVVHIDKDLNQIPGNHYNYKTGKTSMIQFSESYKSLYTQLLMGDSTDNITGVPGIGPKKAEKILAAANSGEDCQHAALKAYVSHYGTRMGIIKFAENYAMVKLLDAPEAGFNPKEYIYRAYSVPQDYLNEVENKFKLFESLTTGGELDETLAKYLVPQGNVTEKEVKQIPD